MDEHTQQLQQYIQAHIQGGTPPETIRQTLVQAGWDATMVDTALQQFAAAAPAQPQPAETQPQQPAFNQPVQQTDPQTNWQQPAIGQPQSPYAQPAAAQPVSQDYIDAPKKYKVFRAIRDSIRAIQNNARAYFLATILSILIAIAATTVGVLATALFYILVLKNHASSSVSLIISGVIIILLFYLVYGFIATVIQVAAALAVYDGAEGKKSAVKPLLANSLRLLGRLILANLLVGVVAVLPLIALGIIALAGTLAGSRGAIAGNAGIASGMNIVLILLGLAAMVWAVIAVIDFCLAPYIAIFEPDLPLRQTLKRSVQLLRHGGYWFLFKGVLLYVAVYIILALFGQSPASNAAVGVGILYLLITLAYGIIANATIVMLYRNRRIVHDSAQSTQQ